MLFGRRSIDRFVAWAKANAVPFEPAEDINHSVEKLSFLDRLLLDKRVVYLGEEDHWVHEKYEYRCLLLRYLFSRGWRYVGEELGWSDGVRIDRYLAAGDRSALERVATYGYRGDIRPDREDSATGILKDTAQNYPVQAFKAGQIRFAEFLRGFNESVLKEENRIRFFGLDVNSAAGGGYRDIEELLGPAFYSAGLAQLKKMLDRVPGETMEQEMGRLDRVLHALEDEKAKLMEWMGEACFAFLHQGILAMRDSLGYYRLANTATGYKELNKAMAAREELMCRHADFVLSQMKPGDKLVLMGHNRHLSKDIGSITKMAGSPPGGKLVPSLGTYLNRRLPGQVFSIWMLHERGKSAQPFTNLADEYTVKPGSLNAILSRAGSRYLLPTAASAPEARLLHSKTDIVGLYNIPFRAAIAGQADAVFFIREVHPLVP